MPHDKERGPGRHSPDPTKIAGLDTDTQESKGSVRQAGVSPLRELLDKTAANEGCSLKDLTVLSPQVDPFRLDTHANHRDGQWLADTLRDLGLLETERTIHLRGVHYAILGRPKPDGAPYVNDDDHWTWLGGAAKAARWLGYIPFERIHDQRNAAPIVRIFQPTDPWPFLNVGVEVDIPDAADIEPRVGLAGFAGVQPFRLVLVGEKSSLDDVLAPVAARYHADLYLPTGNISDTLVHQMARIGAEDGRPMVVFYFSDADPAGWNMPIEVGRKLQAFKASLYPALEFQEHRAALTPWQVPNLGLPSTPLKETEKRADRWRAAWGVEQTEIDALATLQPDLLREIAEALLDPFIDRTLDGRVDRARRAWRAEAQAVVDAGIDQDRLERLRADAAEKLATLRAEIEAINEAARVDADDFDLPPVPPVPPPELDGEQPLPLLDSGWSFAHQCRRLIDSKAYRS
jgi:hypothetical protein